MESLNMKSKTDSSLFEPGRTIDPELFIEWFVLVLSGVVKSLKFPSTGCDSFAKHV